MLIFNRSRIAVLMYHALIDKPDKNIHFVHVLKREFAEQMKWLFENGYRTLRMAELYDVLLNKKKIKDKAVVLTFDDGYRSLYDYATPILQQYGFSAVLFLTTATVGKESYNDLRHCDGYPADDRPLTWSELLEMKGLCWEIEAHGHRHYNHAALDAKALLDEVGRCRRAIKANLNHEPTFYCYPYGAYDASTLDMIDKLGFKASFSVEPGFATSSADLRRVYRVTISVFDDIRTFSNKLRYAFASRKESLPSVIRDLIRRHDSLQMAITSVKSVLANIKIGIRRCLQKASWE